MKINAIIFGATGMVGEGVLIEALKYENVESVLVIGRKPCMKTHAKLKELIHDDFFNYSAIEEQLKGYNACFFLPRDFLGGNERARLHTDYIRSYNAGSSNIVEA
jgi:putative NADH-flavin reductase